jgi:hypothetical protein
MIGTLSGFLLLLPAVGCKSERGLVGPAPHETQDITRFRSKDATKAPVVLGRVYLVDQGRVQALPAAIIALDDSISFTNESGDYRRRLQPGNHRFLAGQIGLYPSLIQRLRVDLGDSVRIDFHLRPDLRPLD